MARLIANNGEYFSSNTVAVSAPPFTMACSFMPDDVTAGMVLMSLCVDGNGDNKHQLNASGTIAGDPVTAASRTTANSFAASTTGYSAGVWNHACGVWRAANDRSAYVNGGSRGDETTSRVPSGMNRTRLATSHDTTTNPLRGRIAEAAIWNVALSDAEVAALGARVSPLRIRPLSLVAYWPVYDEVSLIRDLRGNVPLTVNGSSTVADHAPVSPPFWAPSWEGAFSPPAVTTFNPLMMHHIQIAGGLA